MEREVDGSVIELPATEDGLGCRDVCCGTVSGTTYCFCRQGRRGEMI